MLSRKGRPKHECFQAFPASAWQTTGVGGVPELGCNNREAPYPAPHPPFVPLLMVGCGEEPLLMTEEAGQSFVE